LISLGVLAVPEVDDSLELIECFIIYCRDTSGISDPLFAGSSLESSPESLLLLSESAEDVDEGAEDEGIDDSDGPGFFCASMLSVSREPANRGEDSKDSLHAACFCSSIDARPTSTETLSCF
jgi:hypothetical protein